MGEKVGLIAKDLPAVMDSAVQRVRTGHSLDRQGGASLPSRSAIVLLDLEQAPDPDCRVMLGSERDALGLRRVQVDWKLSELERRSARKLVELIGSDFARLGVGRCRLEPWLTDEHVAMTSALQETYHYMGTTRMSDDPASGVVDRQGAVHGMRNLFVAGSSVFPTGGQANPTLTLVALTLRLADHLKH
jgi:choline dehydrogenase-like flavoprotein